MYPSKILLFGEYTILLNSQALAIPFRKFKADWDYFSNASQTRSQEACDSNQALKEFCSYLKLGEFEIDIEQFEDDLENGLFLSSNIPAASGLGSSGAVVAAILDQYSNKFIDRTNLTSLKNYLAELESYFHGSSSGIDPLVSFLNKAVLFKDKNSIEELDYPIDKILRENNMFLVDSKIDSSTGSLVQDFKNKCKNDPAYLKRLLEIYIPINNACIESLSDSTKDFLPVMKELSHLQLSYFGEMIPEKMQGLMKYGLESDLFHLKLCGSGGGGYFLGFTKDIDKTRFYMENQGFPIFSS